MAKDVADPARREVRVMAERCRSCIYRPDGLQLEPGALARLTRTTAQAEGHLVCHETWMDVEQDVPGAICRGYLDASGDRSLAVRIAHALGRIVDVEPQ